MNRTLAMVVALGSLLAVGVAAQERPMVQLRYAPPAEGQRSYSATLEGSAELAMLNLGTVPITLDLSYDVAYGPERDGVIEERLTYTRVQAMVLGQTVSSSYVNMPRTMRRGVAGQWLPHSDAFPPPRLMSADLFTLFGQVPRMLRLPDHPVGVGDEWGVEREVLPRLFRVGDIPLPNGQEPAPEPPGEAAAEEGEADPGADGEAEAHGPADVAPDEGDAAPPPPADGDEAADPAAGTEVEEAAGHVAPPEEPLVEEPAAEEQPASSTFLTQRNRLENLQDYNGRMAAIIRSEMAVEMVREVFFTGVVVDGRFVANMEQAIYVDTGELIVANVEVAAEFQIPSPMGQITITIPRAFGRYGDPAEITPLVQDQQPRNPAGGRGGRAGVGGGRAGIR